MRLPYPICPSSSGQTVIGHQQPRVRGLLERQRFNSSRLKSQTAVKSDWRAIVFGLLVALVAAAGIGLLFHGSERAAVAGWMLLEVIAGLAIIAILACRK